MINILQEQQKIVCTEILSRETIENYMHVIFVTKLTRNLVFKNNYYAITNAQNRYNNYQNKS